MGGHGDSPSQTFQAETLGSTRQGQASPEDLSPEQSSNPGDAAASSSPASLPNGAAAAQPSAALPRSEDKASAALQPVEDPASAAQPAQLPPPPPDVAMGPREVPVESGPTESLVEETEKAQPSDASPSSPIIIVGGDEAAFPLPSDKGFQFSFGTFEDVLPAQEPKEASEEPRSPAEELKEDSGEPRSPAQEQKEVSEAPEELHDVPVGNGPVEDLGDSPPASPPAQFPEDVPASPAEPSTPPSFGAPLPSAPFSSVEGTEGTALDAPHPLVKDPKEASVSKPTPSRTWASIAKGPAGQPASRAEEASGQVDPVVALLRRALANLSLEQGSVTPQVRGFVNRGNWCYINAVLQALLACPPFFHLLRKLGEVVPRPRAQPSSTPTLDALMDLVRQVQAESGRGKGKPSPIEPVGMQELVGRLCPEDSGSFKHGRQEDAQEFLNYLLNSAHQELLAVEGKEAGEAEEADDEEDWQEVGPGRRAAVTRRHAFRHSPISRIFAGQLRYHISEAGGGKDAVNLEPFFTLSLEIAGDGVISLETALSEHFRKETFRRSVSGTGGAKAEVDATKSAFLGELPQVLAVHLKYFQYSEEAGSAKVFKRIRFPQELAVPSKLLPPKVKAGVRSYKLFAVAFHHGEELNRGHYTADVWTGGRWLEADDARTKSVAPDHLHQGPPQRVPYLLFYRRTDLISPPPSTDQPGLLGPKAKATPRPPATAKPHAALPNPPSPKESGNGPTKARAKASPSSPVSPTANLPLPNAGSGSTAKAPTPAAPPTSVPSQPPNGPVLYLGTRRDYGEESDEEEEVTNPAYLATLGRPFVDAAPGTLEDYLVTPKRKTRLRRRARPRAPTSEVPKAPQASLRPPSTPTEPSPSPPPHKPTPPPSAPLPPTPRPVRHTAAVQAATKPAAEAAATPIGKVAAKAPAKAPAKALVKAPAKAAAKVPAKVRTKVRTKAPAKASSATVTETPASPPLTLNGALSLPPAPPSPHAQPKPHPKPMAPSASAKAMRLSTTDADARLRRQRGLYVKPTEVAWTPGWQLSVDNHLANRRSGKFKVTPATTSKKPTAAEAEEMAKLASWASWQDGVAGDIVTMVEGRPEGKKKRLIESSEAEPSSWKDVGPVLAEALESAVARTSPYATAAERAADEHQRQRVLCAAHNEARFMPLAEAALDKAAKKLSEAAQELKKLVATPSKKKECLSWQSRMKGWKSAYASALKDARAASLRLNAARFKATWLAMVERSCPSELKPMCGVEFNRLLGEASLRTLALSRRFTAQGERGKWHLGRLINRATQDCVKAKKKRRERAAAEAEKGPCPPAPWLPFPRPGATMPTVRQPKGEPNPRTPGPRRRIAPKGQLGLLRHRQPRPTPLKSTTRPSVPGPRMIGPMFTGKRSRGSQLLKLRVGRCGTSVPVPRRVLRHALSMEPKGEPFAQPSPSELKNAEAVTATTAPAAILPPPSHTAPAHSHTSSTRSDTAPAHTDASAAFANSDASPAHTHATNSDASPVHTHAYASNSDPFSDSGCETEPGLQPSAQPLPPTLSSSEDSGAGSEDGDVPDGAPESGDKGAEAPGSGEEENGSDGGEDAGAEPDDQGPGGDGEEAEEDEDEPEAPGDGDDGDDGDDADEEEAEEAEDAGGEGEEEEEEEEDGDGEAKRPRKKPPTEADEEPLDEEASKALEGFADRLAELTLREGQDASLREVAWEEDGPDVTPRPLRVSYKALEAKLGDSRLPYGVFRNLTREEERLWALLQSKMRAYKVPRRYHLEPVLRNVAAGLAESIRREGGLVEFFAVRGLDSRGLAAALNRPRPSDLRRLGRYSYLRRRVLAQNVVLAPGGPGNAVEAVAEALAHSLTPAQLRGLFASYLRRSDNFPPTSDRLAMLFKALERLQMIFGFAHIFSDGEGWLCNEDEGLEMAVPKKTKLLRPDIMKKDSRRDSWDPEEVPRLSKALLEAWADLVVEVPAFPTAYAALAAFSHYLQCTIAVFSAAALRAPPQVFGDTGPLIFLLEAPDAHFDVLAHEGRLWALPPQPLRNVAVDSVLQLCGALLHYFGPFAVTYEADHTVQVLLRLLSEEAQRELLRLGGLWGLVRLGSPVLVLPGRRPLPPSLTRPSTFARSTPPGAPALPIPGQCLFCSGSHDSQGCQRLHDEVIRKFDGEPPEDWTVASRMGLATMREFNPVPILISQPQHGSKARSREGPATATAALTPQPERLTDESLHWTRLQEEEKEREIRRAAETCPFCRKPKHEDLTQCHRFRRLIRDSLDRESRQRELKKRLAKGSEALEFSASPTQPFPLQGEGEVGRERSPSPRRLVGLARQLQDEERARAAEGRRLFPVPTPLRVPRLRLRPVRADIAFCGLCGKSSCVRSGKACPRLTSSQHNRRRRDPPVPTAAGPLSAAAKVLDRALLREREELRARDSLARSAALALQKASDSLRPSPKPLPPPAQPSPSLPSGPQPRLGPQEPEKPAAPAEEESSVLQRLLGQVAGFARQTLVVAVSRGGGEKGNYTPAFKSSPGNSPPRTPPRRRSWHSSGSSGSDGSPVRVPALNPPRVPAPATAASSSGPPPSPAPHSHLDLLVFPAERVELSLRIRSLHPAHYDLEQQSREALAMLGELVGRILETYVRWNYGEPVLLVSLPAEGFETLALLHRSRRQLQRMRQASLWDPCMVDDRAAQGRLSAGAAATPAAAVLQTPPGGEFFGVTVGNITVAELTGGAFVPAREPIVYLQQQLRQRLRLYLGWVAGQPEPVEPTIPVRLDTEPNGRYRAIVWAPSAAMRQRILRLRRPDISVGWTFVAYAGPLEREWLTLEAYFHRLPQPLTLTPFRQLVFSHSNKKVELKASLRDKRKTVTKMEASKACGTAKKFSLVEAANLVKKIIAIAKNEKAKWETQASGATASSTVPAAGASGAGSSAAPPSGSPPAKKAKASATSPASSPAPAPAASPVASPAAGPSTGPSAQTPASPVSDRTHSRFTDPVQPSQPPRIPSFRLLNLPAPDAPEDTMRPFSALQRRESQDRNAVLKSFCDVSPEEWEEQPELHRLFKRIEVLSGASAEAITKVKKVLTGDGQLDRSQPAAIALWREAVTAIHSMNSAYAAWVDMNVGRSDMMLARRRHSALEALDRAVNPLYRASESVLRTVSGEAAARARAASASPSRSSGAAASTAPSPAQTSVALALAPSPTANTPSPRIGEPLQREVPPVPVTIEPFQDPEPGTPGQVWCMAVKIRANPPPSSVQFRLGGRVLTGTSEGGVVRSGGRDIYVLRVDAFEAEMVGEAVVLAEQRWSRGLLSDAQRFRVSSTQPSPAPPQRPVLPLHMAQGTSFDSGDQQLPWSVPWGEGHRQGPPHPRGWQNTCPVDPLVEILVGAEQGTRGQLHQALPESPVLLGALLDMIEGSPTSALSPGLQAEGALDRIRSWFRRRAAVQGPAPADVLDLIPIGGDMADTFSHYGKKLSEGVDNCCALVAEAECEDATCRRRQFELLQDGLVLGFDPSGRSVGGLGHQLAQADGRAQVLYGDGALRGVPSLLPCPLHSEEKRFGRKQLFPAFGRAPFALLCPLEEPWGGSGVVQERQMWLGRLAKRPEELIRAIDWAAAPDGLRLDCSTYTVAGLIFGNLPVTTLDPSSFPGSSAPAAAPAPASPPRPAPPSIGHFIALFRDSSRPGHWVLADGTEPSPRHRNVDVQGIKGGAYQAGHPEMKKLEKVTQYLVDRAMVPLFVLLLRQGPPPQRQPGAGVAEKLLGSNMSNEDIAHLPGTLLAPRRPLPASSGLSGSGSAATTPSSAAGPASPAQASASSAASSQQPSNVLASSAQSSSPAQPSNSSASSPQQPSNALGSSAQSSSPAQLSTSSPTTPANSSSASTSGPSQSVGEEDSLRRDSSLFLPSSGESNAAWSTADESRPTPRASASSTLLSMSSLDPLSETFQSLKSDGGKKSSGKKGAEKSRPSVAFSEAVAVRGWQSSPLVHPLVITSQGRWVNEDGEKSRHNHVHYDTIVFHLDPYAKYDDVLLSFTNRAEDFYVLVRCWPDVYRPSRYSGECPTTTSRLSFPHCFTLAPLETRRMILHRKPHVTPAQVKQMRIPPDAIRIRWVAATEAEVNSGASSLQTALASQTLLPPRPVQVSDRAFLFEYLAQARGSTAAVQAAALRASQAAQGQGQRVPAPAGQAAQPQPQAAQPQAAQPQPQAALTLHAPATPSGRQVHRLAAAQAIAAKTFRPFPNERTYRSWVKVAQQLALPPLPFPSAEPDPGLASKLYFGLSNNIMDLDSQVVLVAANPELSFKGVSGTMAALGASDPTLGMYVEQHCPPLGGSAAGSAAGSGERVAVGGAVLVPLRGDRQRAAALVRGPSWHRPAERPNWEASLTLAIFNGLTLAASQGYVSFTVPTVSGGAYRGPAHMADHFTLPRCAAALCRALRLFLEQWPAVERVVISGQADPGEEAFPVDVFAHFFAAPALLSHFPLSALNDPDTPITIIPPRVKFNEATPVQSSSLIHIINRQRQRVAVLLSVARAQGGGRFFVAEPSELLMEPYGSGMVVVSVRVPSEGPERPADYSEQPRAGVYTVEAFSAALECGEEAEEAVRRFRQRPQEELFVSQLTIIVQPIKTPSSASSGS